MKGRSPPPAPPLAAALHVVDDESDNGGSEAAAMMAITTIFLIDAFLPSFLPPLICLHLGQIFVGRRKRWQYARQLRDIGRREGSADAEGSGEAVIPLSFAPSLPSHQPHAKKVTQRESFPLPPHFPPFPSLRASLPFSFSFLRSLSLIVLIHQAITKEGTGTTERTKERTNGRMNERGKEGRK